MKALERKMYCGLIQQKIEDKYGIKTASTSTGETIWIKEKDYEKVKGHFTFVKMGGQYVIMVNKTLVKKMFPEVK